MVRALITVILVPVLALLAWLALQDVRPRADFVFTAVEPRTIDPQRVSWLPEIEIANALFEGLTRLNPDLYTPEPAVARAWQVSAALREYTFQLRPEARWSNGERVVAEDFRFAWLRVLDPRVEGQYASLLFVIRGAEEYYRSRLDDDATNDVAGDEVAITAPDNATLVVELNAPCPYFLELTAFPTFAPVYPPTVQRWSYRDGRPARARRHLWTRPEHIVCNGAFVPRAWRFKQHLLLERNPCYWDAGAIEMHSIEVYISGDPNVALSAYATGRVDYVRGLPPTTARAILAQQEAGQRSDFHVGDRFATFFYRVNCQRPPLDNADFRRALFLAVDREAICAHVMGLSETPAYTLVPPAAAAHMESSAADGAVVHYVPPTGLAGELLQAERLALARKYLERSGFLRSAARRPIEIVFPPEPEQQRVAEAIQVMWEEGLGIDVELRRQEAKVLSTRIRQLDYDLARSDWFGDYLDPSTFLNLFRAGDSQNRTGWANPRYDELLVAAGAEADGARRYELLREAEEVLCTEGVPVIPVFHRRGNFLLNPRFTGLNDHIRDVLPIQRVKKR